MSCFFVACPVCVLVSEKEYELVESSPRESDEDIISRALHLVRYGLHTISIFLPSEESVRPPSPPQPLDRTRRSVVILLPRCSALSHSLLDYTSSCVQLLGDTTSFSLDMRNAPIRK